MTNGNGSLSRAWEHFDSDTKLDLVITELDRIHELAKDLSRSSSAEHSQIRVEMTNLVAALKGDFNQRIETLRGEVRDGFEKVDARQTKTTSWIIGAVGTLLVGLALLVAQLASGS